MILIQDVWRFWAGFLFAMGCLVLARMLLWGAETVYLVWQLAKAARVDVQPARIITPDERQEFDDL